jgi:polyferredoxin
VPLADFILVVHFLFALFVVGSLPLIWIGAWMGLGFVRNLRFRLAHLLAILFVAGESLIGMVCPLTSLEDALRGTGNAASFVQRWLQRILYYDLPEWVLTVGYVMFALLVAFTFVIVPPSRGKVRR